MKIVEFTEYLVKSVVKEPDMVKVQAFDGDEDILIIEIIVHESDMGIVIGKNGKMSNAIRTLVQAQSYLNDNRHVKINIDSF